MIEQSLRRWLRPVVNRRKKLLLLRRLAIYWFVAALAGIILIAADLLWGMHYSIAFWILLISTAIASIIAWRKNNRIEPDYKTIARNIEKQNPDLKATLLTAIEQKPDEPFGQLGYLQERVIGEALAHAKNHDWIQSVSQKTLILARCGQIAALLLLIIVLSQLLPASSSISRKTGIFASKDYNITVSPGDTTVESGASVVILARFDELLPQEVKLLIGPAPDDTQEMPLTRTLDDPVFGGIISQVNYDMFYHIEYAGRRTRDFKITTYEYPMLERADAKIVYPSYTNLSEKLIKDTRQISIVEGSQVTLTFTLNKTIDTANLVARDGSAIKLEADKENPNVFTTYMEPKESLRYELKLLDTEGRANKVPPRFVIDVQKNISPDLKTIFPNRDVEASPLEELSFEAEVSDDYGVIAHGISYTIAGEQSKDVNLAPAGTTSQKQKSEFLLELEEHNAQPDQLITYSFWADDIGPDGNIRRTSSDLFFIEVRPFEEIFRESQSFQDENNQQQRERENQEGQQGQQGQQNENLIQLQKQIISATWNIKRQAEQSGSIDEQKEDLDLVRQSQADALQQAQSASSQAEEPAEIQALQNASKHMGTSLEHLSEAGQSASTEELTPALAAEQSAYQELLKLRERESNVARSRNAQRNNSNRSARSERQLQQLELQQREDRYENQRLAQSEQQETQREDLQVLNRLRELARRQNEMSERLREAEAALRQARTEQEREEISRELKRLREEQIETLRDVDELQQRMENEQNRQRMADTAEQLSESRSRIQQSAEEIEQGQISDAASSTTRAQRELEQMREEFQRRTSGQFSEQMRNMREQAQQLDERQREISDQIEQQVESRQRTLADNGVNNELLEQLQQQRQNMEELLEQMRDVSEQSENSEPILSRRLYDTLRQARTENIDRALEATGEALRRNFMPQAQQIERQAGEGIENLRQGVEEAARSVLGDEAEALRLAREQLDELIRQVNDEAARAGGTGQQTADPNQTQSQQARAQARQGTGQSQPGDPNQSENQQARAQNRQGMGQGQSGDPNQPGNQQARAQAQQRMGPGQGQPGEPNQPDNQQARAQAGATGGGNRQPQANPNGLGGFRETFQQGMFDPNGPLTGRDFLQWSDRLRDVEEMLSEQELREEVATVRDRARTIRSEFTRHGKEPQWDTVKMEITKPLAEVRERIEEELEKLASKKALVPIDRDPVPSRYADIVRSYYENLGGDD